jgi:epoxyqueuosine reductase
MLNELISELNIRGASFVKTADISMLPEKENRGYHTAILIGIILSPEFILGFSKGNMTVRSEYGDKEHLTQELSEWAADFIVERGFKAFAQSDGNIVNGYFEEATKTSVLPHKKIAILSGVGWIGKNNLLITEEYGCALCMGTVLTNAPLHIENRQMVMTRCGGCTVCKDICPANVIHGTTWEPGMNRDLIVDVYHCECCLKCLVHCPWTQNYMKDNVTA